MTDTNAAIKPSLFQTLYLALREHLSIPLFANAYALIANQVVAAGLGILYWALAARLYPVDVVGENSALISTIIFLSMISELSLKGALTRFIPRAGKNTGRLILYTYAANIVLGVLVGIFMLTVGRHINILASLLNGVGLSPVWLILFSVFWTIFYVQDGILTGMRQAKWVLLKNAALSVTKIVLLILLLGSYSEYGMVNSWFLPVPVFILVFGALIFWRFMPSHLLQDVSHTKPVTRQELLKSTAGDHVGSVLAEACIRVLPLLALYFLGKEATAYFNQAWIIASTFQAISTNMASSFIVEASADMHQISLNSRRIIRQMLFLLVPAVAVMWFGAPFVLYIFGKNYSEQSFVVLRWLVVATIPYMFIAWYLGYARVLSKVGEIILIQGAQLVFTLVAAYFLLPRFGIAGIGLAWLSGQTLVALGIFIKAIPILWPKLSAAEKSLERTKNKVLRRVDWRFLLAKSRFQKSILFSSDEHLRTSLSVVSVECIGPSLIPPEDCDMAVAVSPNQQTLSAAYKAITADGSLYTEWLPWRAGGMKGIRSKLERAGFKNLKFYWPLPNPTEAKVWLPLPSSMSTLQYLSRTLLPGERGIVPFLRNSLVAMLALIARFEMMPYLSVVGDKRSTASDDIFDVIRARYHERNPATPLDRLSFLMKSSGIQINSKIIVLVYNDPSSSIPVWVIKIPRLPIDAVTLEHEKAILAVLNPLVQEREFPFSVPEFLFSQAVDGVDLYAQTALAGVAFGNILKSRGFAEAAARLTEIQIALAQRSARRSNVNAAKQEVGLLLNDWSYWSLGHIEQEDVARIYRIVSFLPSLPEVYAQNDFTPWNIVEGSDKTGIFDWSDASENGLPLLDLVYGLATAAFVSSGASASLDTGKIYRQLIEPQTPLGMVFGECLDAYARAVGLPPESIGPLRLLTWIKHSLYEFKNDQLESDSSNRPLESVCIPLLKIEIEAQCSAFGYN